MSAPVVWLLEQGERGEGGSVLGVYATRELVAAAFAEAARKMPFPVDGLEPGDDGEMYLTAGIDWMTATPHVVATTPELPATGGAR